jgi:predicted membrane-bound spermidine synthase
MGGRRATLVLLPVFFASGFAALAYQIVWQRLLAFFSGADVFSVTLIVCAFMAGLGVGSAAGGHLADRLSPARCVLAFALAEAAIAAFALVSVPLLYDVLYVGLAPRALPLALVGCVLFAVLLWPTFFMGMSLPLLARALTETPAASARRIGSLYAWNTLGAAVGALVTVFWVVRLHGFAAAIGMGAFLNLACAATGLLALRWLRFDAAVPAAPVVASAPPAARAEGRFPFAIWLLLYCLSGFVALSLEILWFRLLGVVVKSNSFTFAWLLTLYLSGLGLGALLGRSPAARSAHPERGFLVLQMLVAAYAGLSLVALVHGLDSWPSLGALRAYLGQYEPLDVYTAARALLRHVLRLEDASPFARDLGAQLVWLYVGVPAVLIGVPTLFMGASFPFLQRAVHADLDHLGRRVGFLQGANIVGSTVGAGLTGLVLVEVIGTAGSLRVLVALGSVFALAAAKGVHASRGARLGYGIVAVAFLGLAALCPPGDRLWARLHGSEPASVLFDEDGSGLSLLKEGVKDGGPHVTVFVNGLGQSSLPYGGYHTVLGALPAMLHPRPEAIAVIGLGSADTLFGIAGRPETRSIDCVEIVAPQKRTLEALARRRLFPGLEQILDDRRVRILAGDGRAFLAHSEKRYDLIEADALRPTSAWAGNLYSLEYFALVRSRLRPGGYAVSWSPTRRVRDTMIRSFPHVLQVGSTLIGSDEPIAWDPDRVARAIREPFAAAHYRHGEVEPEALLRELISPRIRYYDPDYDRSSTGDVNTDLFPKDEYGGWAVPAERARPAPAPATARAIPLC